MNRRGFTLLGRRLPAWVFIILLMGGVTAVTGIPYAIAGKDAGDPGYAKIKTALPLPAGVTIDQLTQADVYDVIDGDTIQVLIDHKLEVVRYYGVDAPENTDHCYIDATERNRRLIGSKVLLLADARDRDSFNRLLRYVFKSDGTSVDATLVAEGLAEAWRQDGQYKDQIVTLEAQARAENRGCLWRAPSGT
jgi:endonuclease YncB( thermonuclease family)